MAAKRSLRTSQEDKLFDILLLMKIAGDGLPKDVSGYLTMMREKALSGMKETEIDAVTYRTSVAYKAMYQKEE